MNSVPLTWARVVTTWVPDWPVLVFAVLAAFAYFRAIRRAGNWPVRRTALFCSGLASAVLVTCSFLGAYGDVLFWVRAAQTVVLLMLTPLLLALGAPLTLVLAAAPGPVAAALRRIGRGRFARAATFPLVITVLFLAPPFLLYLTPLYEASLRHGAVGELVRLALVLCGFAYFWTRLRLDPTPREDHHLVSFGISFAEVVLDAGLGLVLWLGPLRAADYYHALARAWGPDLRTDQIIGAGVLWIGGDLAGLPFVGALFTRWMRDDERQAKRVDEELDEAPVAASGLWWENDPALADRFRRG